MNNHIYLKNYGTIKNIKSDSIRTYCTCERLDEAYIRTSIGKRSLLTRLWNAVIKELTSPENGFETQEPIQKMNQHSVKSWNVVK